MSGPACLSRVQLLISGKFIILAVLGVTSLAAGYYWYTVQMEAQRRQEQTRARFAPPPYFVNRGKSVIRSCQRCLDGRNLKPQTEWRVGVPNEVPEGEQRWFLSVENPPVPATVAGVLMLPVYPSLTDDPTLGFDQGRVLLVLYQNLQRMPWVQQLPRPTVVSAQPESPPERMPTPPAAESAPTPEAETPPGLQSANAPVGSSFVGIWKNEDSQTRGVTRFSIAGTADQLTLHAWGKCSPVDCDWKETAAGVRDEVLSVLWDKGFATCAWLVSQESADRLRVSEHIHFTDGRRDVDATRYFFRSSEGQE